MKPKSAKPLPLSEEKVDLLNPKQKRKPHKKMGRRADARNQMLGKVFGRLTISKIAYNKNRHIEALCSCGEKWTGFYGNVLAGKSTSCGCSRSINHTKVGAMVGKAYTRLLVTFDDGKKAKATCVCGNSWSGNRYHVLCGATKSCGCLQKEKVSKLNLTHGHCVGGKPSKILQAWKAMYVRCYGSHPINHRYLSRKIQVCDRWKKGDGIKSGFLCFCEDIGTPTSKYHTVERIDNEGHYAPENVRWATHKEQMNNQCRNKILTFNNQTKTLTQWAEAVGLNPHTLSARLRVYGWTIEKALTQPLQYA